MNQPNLTPFSSSYALAPDVTVRTWNEASAHMDIDLYERLVEFLGGPIFGLVGGKRFQFQPSRQVLSEECAVPKKKDGQTVSGTVLLVEK